MKITKTQLKEIIKEEIEKAIKEAPSLRERVFGQGDYTSGSEPEFVDWQRQKSRQSAGERSQKDRAKALAAQQKEYKPRKAREKLLKTAILAGDAHATGGPGFEEWKQANAELAQVGFIRPDKADWRSLKNGFDEGHEEALKVQQGEPRTPFQQIWRALGTDIRALDIFNEGFKSDLAKQYLAEE